MDVAGDAVGPVEPDDLLVQLLHREGAVAADHVFIGAGDGSLADVLATHPRAALGPADRILAVAPAVLFGLHARLGLGPLGVEDPAGLGLRPLR